MPASPQENQYPKGRSLSMRPCSAFVVSDGIFASSFPFLARDFPGLDKARLFILRTHQGRRTEAPKYQGSPLCSMTTTATGCGACADHRLSRAVSRTAQRTSTAGHAAAAETPPLPGRDVVFAPAPVALSRQFHTRASSGITVPPASGTLPRRAPRAGAGIRFHAAAPVCFSIEYRRIGRRRDDPLMRDDFLFLPGHP